VLTPGRYVGAEELEDEGEPFDEKMARLVNELNAQFAESAKLEQAIKANLTEISYATDWTTRPLEDCMAAIIDYRANHRRKQRSVSVVTAKIIKSGRIEPRKSSLPKPTTNSGCGVECRKKETS